MLKKALLELLIKKEYEIYFCYSGDMVSYNIEKSEFYINDKIVTKSRIEDLLDNSLNFYDIYIYQRRKLIEFE